MAIKSIALVAIFHLFKIVVHNSETPLQKGFFCEYLYEIYVVSAPTIAYGFTYKIGMSSESEW